MNGTNLRSNPGAYLPALGAPSAAARLARALRTLRLWRERTRTRQELMRLDDRLLQDIGLTRDEVMAEWRKPFWRP